MEGNYSKALNSLIPGGAHTYSRGDDQYPSNAPAILQRGLGAYVWDPQGKKFLDYGMALRAVTLGYANERVNNAAIKAIMAGVNLTRPTITELEAAQTMVDLIPGAEMVKFAKNGSNVTSAAVKLARAYTGRHYVCVPRQHPFFSFDDWFIGSTTVKRGIPEEYYKYTLVFDYNDITSLEQLFAEYPSQIAAVMLEPATTLIPCTNQACSPHQALDSVCSNCPHRDDNFLVQVQRLCRKEGVVFILDEMISGFRWHLQGAQTFFGVEPDLSTFGKGMANGFSVAALVGKQEIMQLGGIYPEGMERTFLMSTTHGAEMPGLAAFVETVDFYKEHHVIDHLWEFGSALFCGLNNLSKKLGLSDYFYLEGGYVAMNYITKDNLGNISLPFRTLFAQEMIKNGVLIPWIAPSFSHGKLELDITLEAAEKALKTYAMALNNGIEHYLEGSPIKPVFRRFN